MFIKYKFISPTTFLNEFFYKKTIELYKSLKENNEQNAKKLRKFIKCLPTFYQISSFISKYDLNDLKNKKNVWFIKVCLDILEDYYSGICFDKLKKYKLFLKVSLKFHSNIEEETYEFLKNQKNIYFLNTSTLGKDFEQIMSKQEFLKEKKKELEILYGGLSEEKFLK